eukprot:TRINITY_DN7011_c0_g1_i1.p1 TRINITY_DN7011_c0_g1~~TRINITY_DN7011_c0_g1_i1.p1  ORF type:complete len:625 (+),score=107.71 TRINITY_DN7011_c0_g1_i1:214-1875(+)
MSSNYWLSYWSNQMEGDKKAKPLHFYLLIYVAIGVANCLFVLARSLLLAVAGVIAARTIHNSMLQRLMRAPTSFFDTTPVGRILNRFSKDIYTVDEQLPRVLGMSISTCLSVLAVIIIISSVTPVFLISLIPLTYLYNYIQQYYMSSSRELKRLDSVSKSPVYALFSETLSGVSTIRAYSKEGAFSIRNETQVDQNNRAYYMWLVSNRWLGLRLEFVGACVVFGSAFFAVLDKGSINPGLAGLSITYALQLTGQLNWLVRMSTEVETNLIAVERCVEYSEMNVEADPLTSYPVPGNWPSKGVIKFSDLSIRYREGLPLVLQNVSITTNPQEKIGVVGRTGAGKSSLMLALFRIVEPSSGTVYIDDIDICQLGLEQLRSKLAIIPQEPTLFTGTIRTNLDPFDDHTDAELWSALDAVYLREQVEKMTGLLNASVSEYGENLSVGTRQLMCLARALLRKSKVLVMDEATASVDFETDALIQKTIREQFKNVTVLTIAHRINTIADSDRVLVLDKGKVAEFDTPQNLLKDPNSIYSSLVAKSDVKKTDQQEGKDFE